MKKLKALPYLLFGILLVLVACSPPSAESVPTEQNLETAPEIPPANENALPDEDETAPTVGSTIVNWLVRADENEPTWEQKIVADFEAMLPEIGINLVVVPWNEFDTDFSIPAPYKQNSISLKHAVFLV